jgi:recombination protein RecT
MATQNQPVNATKAIEKVNQELQTKGKIASVEDLIKSSISQLKLALPQHMSAERLCRIALTTLRVNPKLQKCSGRSFIAALFQSAQLGLEPNVNGESWIIPYNLKSGETVAQFQIGAYGLVKLFWNHKNAASIQKETVREKDLFEYDLGTGELKHKPPAFGQDRGKAIGYYAVGILHGGGRIVKVMSYNDVLEHAKRFSKCWDKKEEKFINGTPWESNFDSMGEVTVLKQVMKLLPKSVEIQNALRADGSIRMDVDSKIFDEPNQVAFDDVAEDSSEIQDAEVVEETKVDKKTGEIAGTTSPAKKEDKGLLFPPEEKKTASPPDTSFLSIVEVLKKRVPEDEYRTFLYELGIEDVALLQTKAEKDKFLAKLNKRVNDLEKAGRK